MPGIDINQATALPPDLEVASIDTTPAPLPVVVKVVPEQSWAMNMAMNFVNMQTEDLRNPDTMGQLIADTIAPTLPTVSVDSNVAYLNSVSRRADVELPPIDQDVYDQQIDQKRAKEFSIELLNAIGIESDLGQDTVTNEKTPTIVNVEDTSVRTVWEEQPETDLESRAIAIAQRLGITLAPPPVYNQNLVIPAVYEVDSTDPYVQKVMGR